MSQQQDMSRKRSKYGNPKHTYTSRYVTILINSSSVSLPQTTLFLKRILQSGLNTKSDVHAVHKVLFTKSIL